MRIREVVVLLLPALTRAADVAPTDTSVDTFGKLLAKQAQVVASEYDAKIRANQRQVAVGQFGITPLPGAKQDMNDKEPTVEAIWGLVGKAAAQVNYKGRHIAVSMQAPYISKRDGWKLESIKPYEIALVRANSHRVTHRKSVTLDWNNGSTGQAAMDVLSGQTPQTVTPPITAPVIR